MKRMENSMNGRNAEAQRTLEMGFDYYGLGLSWVFAVRRLIWDLKAVDEPMRFNGDDIQAGGNGMIFLGKF